MRNFDHQARSNVLRKLISLMGDQMAKRSPGKLLSVEIKHGGAADPLASESDEQPNKHNNECPHCDGEGCRFCK